MRLLGLSKRELQIMEAVWRGGRISIREIHEAIPAPRPVYNSIQTTVYRMEAKKLLRRARKIGNAHMFEAAVTRAAAQGRLLDHVLQLFGGRLQPVMAHWFESGKITPAEIDEAERMFRRLAAERAGKLSGKKGRKP